MVLFRLWYCSDCGIVQTVELFRLWYCSDCGIVQTVELFRLVLFRLWYCADCGIVQTLELFRLVFICFSCYLFFIVRSFVISFDFIVFVLLNLIGIEHR